MKKSSKRTINPLILFLSLALLMIIIDDRIVKYFMINVPFFEIERLWVFRDFILVPFLAILIGGAIQKVRAFLSIIIKNVSVFSRKTPIHKFSKAHSFLARIPQHKAARFAQTLMYVGLLMTVSGWMTASVYYAYPHFAPLQTTSYELEAVKYIEATTNETYIVISDMWITYAGGMLVGIGSPCACYFYSGDPHGVALFLEMKNNPTNETMKEAMKTNNATVAYFIIEKPRLGEEIYNDVINQARQNDLQTYKVFYYPEGEEKLRIFYFQRES